MRSLFSSVVLILSGLFSFTFLQAQVPVKGEALPPWKEGWLDLHHINTGRGNAAYYLFPDGTSMLFDAGEQNPDESRTTSVRNSPIRPNNKKHPYEWIVSYIRQVAPRGQSLQLDYAVISHFHDDHMGSYYQSAPKSAKGNYVLTGITGVAELLPVKLLIDRGYPSYDYPINMKSHATEEKARLKAGDYNYWQTMQNYFSFIDAGRNAGMQVSRLKAGSRQQVSLQYGAKKYPQFFVRNVKCNGTIWTGSEDKVFEQFPAGGSSAAMPSENALSQVLTINYGPFKYYTGGDCPGLVPYGGAAWMDVETPIAKAVGAVDIATMDHHGNRDAVNENMVKALRPRVWIEQVWSSDHPGQEVLIRVTTPYLYNGPRDLFATNMLQPNKYVIGPLIDQSYKSQQGHILVRVMPGGDKYYVIILDDSQEILTVKDVFGPYLSGKK